LRVVSGEVRPLVLDGAQAVRGVVHDRLVDGQLLPGALQRTRAVLSRLLARLGRASPCVFPSPGWTPAFSTRGAQGKQLAFHPRRLLQVARDRRLLSYCQSSRCQRHCSWQLTVTLHTDSSCPAGLGLVSPRVEPNVCWGLVG
jgi:hypothetical protein